MIITSYTLTADNALALMHALEEDETHADEEMAYDVRETLEDTYRQWFPTGFNVMLTFTWASRFEQNVMDKIDALNIAHETTVTETDE